MTQFEPGKKAERLVSEVAFAASLINPQNARRISNSPADCDLFDFDKELAEALSAHAAMKRVKWRDGPLAPLLRFFTRQRRNRLLKELPLKETEASAAKEGLSVSQLYDPDWGFDDKPLKPWPTRKNGRPMSVSEVAGGSGECQLVLSPYQIRAMGLIEMVRAAGKHQRPLGMSGDDLADLYCALILGFAGVSIPIRGEPHEISPPDSWLRVDFQNLCRGLEMTEESKASYMRIKTYLYKGKGYLSGEYQMLAVSILASWLRMSRFGVRLSSRDRLRSWRLFFDGTEYHHDSNLIGEAWLMSRREARDVLARFEISTPWLETPKGTPPWLSPEGGVPMIFVGLAADALLAASQALGSPHPEATKEEIAELRHSDFSRIEIQLSHYYRDLTCKVEGSVKGMALIDKI